jgi:hypothetical protein
LSWRIVCYKGLPEKLSIFLINFLANFDGNFSAGFFSFTRNFADDFDHGLKIQIKVNGEKIK